LIKHANQNWQRHSNDRCTACIGKKISALVLVFFIVVYVLLRKKTLHKIDQSCMQKIQIVDLHFCCF